MDARKSPMDRVRTLFLCLRALARGSLMDAGHEPLPQLLNRILRNRSAKLLHSAEPLPVIDKLQTHEAETGYFVDIKLNTARNYYKIEFYPENWQAEQRYLSISIHLDGELRYVGQVTGDVYGGGAKFHYFYRSTSQPAASFATFEDLPRPFVEESITRLLTHARDFAHEFCEASPPHPSR